jgi:hypothetical protein
LLILHFVLNTISVDGSPANTVYEFLKGFYKVEGTLVFETVRFNLNDEVESHAKEMKKLVTSINA